MKEQNLFAGLSDELKRRIKNCATKEELERLMEEEGMALSEELLEAASGGFDITLDSAEETALFGKECH